VGLQFNDLKIRAFVKTDEKMPYTIDTGHKRPRIIQGRSEKVKAFTGPVFCALGDHLKCAWPLSPNSVINYASGCSSEELGDLYNLYTMAGYVPLTFDGKTFDSSVGPGAILSWTNDLRTFGVSHKLVTWSGKRAGIQRGYTRSGVFYTRSAQVNSGDCDTSVGNSANHGKLWLAYYIYSKVDMHVIINGDDSVVFVSADDVKRVRSEVPHFALNYGFELVEDIPDSLHHVSFCSGYFYRVGDTMIFGPKIGRVLAKTFWTYDKLTSHKSRRWLRGVALGLQASTSFIPILHIIIKSIIDNTSSLKPHYTHRSNYEKIVAQEIHSPTIETVNQFCSMYDLELTQLARLESIVSRIDFSRPVLLDLIEPLFLRFIHIDL
jgi:hypothetical protein